MLPIIAKTYTLKEEVFSGISVYKDIIGTLENVSIKTTNFKDEVGIFALQAPDWKIMTCEKSKMQDIIRKVCTGEIAPDRAKKEFESSLIELEQLYSWLQLPSKK